MAGLFIRRLLACVVPVMLASEVLAGGVVIFDAPGLGVLPNIQSAVNAATSGDVLLIAPGSYPSFTIDGKSLNVFALPGDAVHVDGTITITNIGAGQRVVLSGISATALAATSPFAQPQSSLVLTDNAGTLRFQSCSFVGGRGVFSTNSNPLGVGGPGGQGVDVLDSLRVAFTRCMIVGGEGGGTPQVFTQSLGGGGGAAVRAQNSASAFYDCTLIGGVGGKAGERGGVGGNGLEQFGFGVFASGATFRGGRGGVAWDYLASGGGAGGNGMELSSSDQAQLVDCTLAEGHGGLAPNVGASATGPAGAPYGGGGIVHTWPNAARHFTCAAIAPELSSLAIQVTGQPDDLALSIAADKPAWAISTLFAGLWLIPKPNTPFLWDDTTWLDANGQGSLTRILPAANNPNGGRIVWLQGFVIGADGRSVSMPMQVLVLDPSLPPDCDANGVNDWLEWAMGVTGDCNGDLLTDRCAIFGGAADCNQNGVPDTCDIASGTSSDVNGNGTPDECEGAVTTIWVDVAAAPGGNGSPSAPFQSLGDALAASLAGDTIVVRDGLYSGTANRQLALNGRSITIRSEHGPANCVIEAQGQGFVFSATSGEQARIQGFTIRGARRALWIEDPTPPYPSVELVDCVVTQCTNLGSAPSALDVRDGAARVERCIFSANTSSFSAPVIGSASALTLVKCEFTGNGSVPGTVVALEPASTMVRIESCSFLGNNAVSVHDATIPLASAQRSLVIDNCLFASNTVTPLVCDTLDNSFTQESVRVLNSTFVGNSAPFSGGAVYVGSEKQVELSNCVLWANTATVGSQIAIDDALYGNSTVVVQRCDVQGGQAGVLVSNGHLNWGAGNLALDPLFVDIDGPDGNLATFADNDWRLALGSPCIDAGDNALAANDEFDLDQDGNTGERVPVDRLGALRFVDVPSAPDVGAGIAPLVDLGCFEHP